MNVITYGFVNGTVFGLLVAVAFTIAFQLGRVEGRNSVPPHIPLESQKTLTDAECDAIFEPTENFRECHNVGGRKRFACFQ